MIGCSEFLETVGKLSKNTDKIAALKHNDSIQMRTLLQGAYDSSVVWDLPPGIPPYTPNKLVDQEGVLHKYITDGKMLYFIKGFHKNLSALKKEQMFIELLERLAPKDASLLCAIKDKKPIKGISGQLVNEAYPGMIQGKIIKEEKEDKQKEEKMANLEIAGIE